MRRTIFPVFLFLFFFANNFMLHGEQFARVLVEKAIIYADLDQKVPIGHLSRGQIVRIGEARRKRGALYPLVLSGRIVYIRAKDIRTSRDENLIGETKIDDEVIGIIHELNFSGLDVLWPWRLSALWSFQFMGNEWEDFFERITSNSTQKEPFMANKFGIYAQYHFSRYISAKFGPSILYTKKNDFSFLSGFLEGHLRWDYWFKNCFAFGPEIRLGFAPYTRIKYLTRKTSATIWGLGLVGNFSYRMSLNWGLDFALGYQNYFLSSLKEDSLTESLKDMSFIFSGFQISLGTIYHF